MRVGGTEAERDILHIYLEALIKVAKYFEHALWPLVQSFFFESASSVVGLSSSTSDVGCRRLNSNEILSSGAGH